MARHLRRTGRRFGRLDAAADVLEWLRDGGSHAPPARPAVRGLGPPAAVGRALPARGVYHVARF